MAVLYAAGSQGGKLATELKKASLPYLWMAAKNHKASYQPGDDKVSLLTIHSSKGLKFSRVIIVGVGHLKDDEELLSQEARLLYVGMTRAMECLLVTTSAENKFSQKLSETAVQ